MVYESHLDSCRWMRRKEIDVSEHPDIIFLELDIENTPLVIGDEDRGTAPYIHL